MGPVGTEAKKEVYFNEAAPGLLRASIFSLANNGVIPDGVIGYVVFDVKAGVSNLALIHAPSAGDPSGNPTPIVAENGTLTSVPGLTTWGIGLLCILILMLGIESLRRKAGGRV